MDKCCDACRYSMLREVSPKYSVKTIVDQFDRRVQVISSVGITKFKACVRHGINIVNSSDYFCDDFERYTSNVGILKKVDKE